MDFDKEDSWDQAGNNEGRIWIFRLNLELSRPNFTDLFERNYWINVFMIYYQILILTMMPYLIDLWDEVLHQTQCVCLCSL